MVYDAISLDDEKKRVDRDFAHLQRFVMRFICRLSVLFAFRFFVVVVVVVSR